MAAVDPGLLAAVSYGVLSTAITLFNKAVLSTYSFDSALTLTLLQGIVTVLSLEGMKWRGWITYPSFNLKTAQQMLPLSLVFVAYVVMSLVALSRVNVPMFTALRRLTIVFVMIEEYFYFGTVPSRNVLYSVGTQGLGAGIAAWRDLTFDPVSYFYLFLTNLFTSLYTIYINVARNRTKMNVFGLLYYNTVTTLPLILVLAVVTGDLNKAWHFPHAWDWRFQLSFQSSIFMAVLLNISTFYSTTLNSARTQTVVGQMKNFFAFLLGLLLFHDYVYDHLNFVGLLIGFLGGVQYSYVTYLDKVAKDAAKAKDINGKLLEGGDSNKDQSVVVVMPQEDSINDPKENNRNDSHKRAELQNNVSTEQTHHNAAALQDGAAFMSIPGGVKPFEHSKTV